MKTVAVSKKGGKLKTKLMAMNIVSTGAALVVAVLVLATHDYRTFRSGLISETQTYADIVAGNSTASLSFGDGNDAGQTLASLRAEPHVMCASIYDSSRKTLA